MASVFEATHEQLRKTVALKILHPHVAAEPKAVARFLREGRAAARIRHPHAVSVLDAGTTSDGTSYLVMELERGETLASWIRAFGFLSPAQAVDIMLPVLSAIAHAHSLSIIHRDLKPANILIGLDHRGEPVPRIADFGISRTDGTSDDHLLTGDRGLLGTLAYMAPEQITTPHDVGAAADQYSAGVVLYHCLTGRLPFEASGSIELAHSILEAAPAPMRGYNAEIPQVLESIVNKALQRNPAQRYLTIGALARELIPFASSHTALLHTREFAEDTKPRRMETPEAPGMTFDDSISAPAATRSARMEPAPRRHSLAWVALGLVGVPAIVALALAMRNRPTSLLPVAHSVSAASDLAPSMPPASVATAPPTTGTEVDLPLPPADPQPEGSTSPKHTITSSASAPRRRSPSRPSPPVVDDVDNPLLDQR